MIELDRHIEILLLSNDCVIVPDLGGFMAHHVDARYDEDDNTFLPPLRTLGFNPQLTMNDSLLVQSYVEAYDMSYPEALRRIEDEVDELKQYLQNEGCYELNDIGVLSLNEEGKYVFTPCEAGILTPELYGLSSFEMKRLNSRNQQKSEDLSMMVQEPEDVISEAETTDVTPTKEDDDHDHAIIIKMSWVRNAVAMAAAVVAFFLLTTPISNSESNAIKVNNLNNASFMGMLSKDSNSKKLDYVKEDIKPVDYDNRTVQIHKAEADSISRKEESQIVVSKPYYCIVLASYITKKNANAFVESLHKKGYPEAEVFIRNNVTRVILGNFETESEAHNKLNSVRSDQDFAEAWVLKVKDSI